MPEEFFYYIYAVLYSNIYRETYAEFLKIDFSEGVSGKRSRVHNKFFLSQGKVGLWSKADSKTYFDNFILDIK